jgi:hypothetical protein
MQRRTFLIAFAALPAAQARVPEPWFGTWSLQLPNSDTSAGAPRYKRVTSRIEPWQDGLKVTYDMVGVRGGVTHMEWTGKFDGKDYPLQGSETVATHAYRRIDDRSYEIVIKDDGVMQATARVVVSPDGKTLQVTTEGKSASGKTVKSTVVYERQ